MDARTQERSDKVIAAVWSDVLKLHAQERALVSVTAPRPRAPVRTSQLAHSSRSKLDEGTRSAVDDHVPERLEVAGFRRSPLAGFEVITEGKLQPIEWTGRNSVRDALNGWRPDDVCRRRYSTSRRSIVCSAGIEAIVTVRHALPSTEAR